MDEGKIMQRVLEKAYLIDVLLKLKIMFNDDLDYFDSEMLWEYKENDR